MNDILTFNIVLLLASMAITFFLVAGNRCLDFFEKVFAILYVGWVVFILSLLGWSIYVVAHFNTKYW